MIRFHFLLMLVCSVTVTGSDMQEECLAGDHLDNSELQRSCEPEKSHSESTHQKWTKGPLGTHESTTRSRWEKYEKIISEALEAYVPCDVVPELADHHCYADVLAADLKPYRKSGGLTEQNIQQALPRGVLYQMLDGKLYRQKECLFPSRCAGVEHFLLQFVKHLPNLELVINVQDYPQISIFEPNLIPVFSFSKTPSFQDILYPAWTFWEGGPAIASYPRGLGRWDLLRVQMLASAGKWPWENKKTIAFFRGSRTSIERDPLIRLSVNQPDLVDARYTKNQAWRSEKDTLGFPPATEVPLEDHCKFKYLFNFRGIAASFRFKHLFLCESVVLHVDSEWTEFFYPAIKPWVHYVPVKTDLSDAQELIEFLRDRDELARQIATRGKEFVFRHLAMKDVELYWKQLLTDYAELLTYTVKQRSDLMEISERNN